MSSSEDADKFETLAETGESKRVCVFLSVLVSLESDVHECSVFQSLNTLRAVYKLMIFL